MPYAEKAVPSSKFVNSNTLRKVGRNTLAKTKGKKKIPSPARISATNVNILRCFTNNYNYSMSAIIRNLNRSSTIKYSTNGSLNNL